jgi:oxygen-independent coproporphyrinogen III oxidase
MMPSPPRFDAALLQRHDRPGPRYTSYPSAPQFSSDFTLAELRDYARRSNAPAAQRPLSLYLHIPFCFSPCFYCGCNRLVSRDALRGERYAERLLREIELMAPLFAPGREVVHTGAAPARPP